MADDSGLVFPFLDLCGIERDYPARGQCRAWVEVRRETSNSMGMAHGGLVMTLMDAAMGGAARDVQEGETTVVTIDMQTTFLAPARGRVEALARVIRSSRSFVFAECSVTDASGGLVAKASGLFRPVDRERMEGRRPRG